MDTRYGEACCGVIEEEKTAQWEGGGGVKGVSDSSVFKQKGKIK
jgi:hypothetical protein